MDDDDMLRLVTAVSEVQAVVPDAALGAASAAVRKFNFDTAKVLFEEPTIQQPTTKRAHRVPDKSGAFQAISFLLDNGGRMPAEPSSSSTVLPGGRLHHGSVFADPLGAVGASNKPPPPQL
jgi:hypothetical protein